MTEAEREFMKWLVAEHLRTLRRIDLEANGVFESWPDLQQIGHLYQIKNLCWNSRVNMNRKLAKIPESDRAKW